MNEEATPAASKAAHMKTLNPRTCEALNRNTLKAYTPRKCCTGEFVTHAVTIMQQGLVQELEFLGVSALVRVLGQDLLASVTPLGSLSGAATKSQCKGTRKKVRKMTVRFAAILTISKFQESDIKVDHHEPVGNLVLNSAEQE